MSSGDSSANPSLVSNPNNTTMPNPANANANPNNPNAPTPDAAEAPARESMSLKRGREGSVDLLASETPSIIPIVTKKNRIAEETAENTDDETSTPVPDTADADAGDRDSAARAPAKETRTVGEVRKKVEEMTWKEGGQPGAASGEDSKVDGVVDAEVEVEGQGDKRASAEKADDGGDGAESDTSNAKSAESDPQSLKRKANDTENGVASEEKKRKSTSPAPETATAPAAPAPKKPQATFGAFSAKASPFATAGSSAFGSASSSPSPFGAAASTTSASPFGAAASTGSSSPFGATAAKPATKGFAASGFGSYSSANAFSTFGKKAGDDDKGTSSSFTEILKERGEEVEETKLHLDKQDVPTGEEDEDTVYQTRVKLYALDDESGGWKERGVGALKLNKRRDGSGCRLVMRADGVLRVILNSALFVGMQCLQDGKHVRTSVFEGNKTLRHLTMRTSNPKVAAELHDAIHEHMPLESRKSSSPEVKVKPQAEAADKEEEKKEASEGEEEEGAATAAEMV